MVSTRPGATVLGKFGSPSPPPPHGPGWALGQRGRWRAQTRGLARHGVSPGWTSGSRTGPLPRRHAHAGTHRPWPAPRGVSHACAAVWTGAFAVGRCTRCGPGVEPPARQGCARTHRPTRFCSRAVCVYTRVHVGECSGTCVPGTVVGGLACQQPPCLPVTCSELWKPRARSQGKSPRAVGE